MSGKTHAELIKEMNCGPIPDHRHDREILRYYAYELDAAHKREVDALKKQVGNAAKLREALKLCLRGMCGYCRMDAEARGMTTECVNGCEVMLGAKAALAATEKEGGNDAD